MKTTDSVMREKKYSVKKATEWALYELSLEPNWRHVSDEEVLRIVIKAVEMKHEHSLAEARREVDEEWRKKIGAIKKPFIEFSHLKCVVGSETCPACEIALYYQVKLSDLLTGDNPERKV